MAVESAPTIGGAYKARRAVVDFLELQLPTMYPKLGRIWDLQQYQQWLPPKRIYDFEIIRLEPKEFPVMVVSVLNTGGMTPMGPDDVTGEALFAVEYQMRVYAWMRDTSQEVVSKLRDHQIASVRLALTDNASLRPDADRTVNSDISIRVRPDTFSEDYSEITGHGQNYYIAGSFISFRASILERGGIDVVDTDAATPGELTSAPSGGWDFDVEAGATTGSDLSRPTLDLPSV